VRECVVRVLFYVDESISPANLVQESWCGFEQFSPEPSRALFFRVAWCGFSQKQSRSKKDKMRIIRSPVVSASNFSQALRRDQQVVSLPSGEQR
jgi:hypothetical protein